MLRSIRTRHTFRHLDSRWAVNFEGEFHIWIDIYGQTSHISWSRTNSLVDLIRRLDACNLFWILLDATATHSCVQLLVYPYRNGKCKVNFYLISQSSDWRVFDWDANRHSVHWMSLKYLTKMRTNHLLLNFRSLLFLVTPLKFSSCSFLFGNVT